jgi:fucose permease
MMTRRGRFAAGLVGGASLVAIGWSGLLVPSLIRSVQGTFDQDDAGIGLFYLLWAVAYASGSFVSGPLTERLGRRWVLGGAALLHGLAVVGLGLAPSWIVFLATGPVAAAAAGSLDGGANGLVLDVYREGRGRAMNLLHASFSVGALAAPLVVGSLVSAGAAWQTVVVGSGVALSVLAVGYALVPMPSGRRAVDSARTTDESGSGGQVGVDGSPGGGWLLRGPLLLLGIAIAAYVASELGVSNWLVRFLEPAPLATATLALSFYWLGLTAGRLVSSAIADRFDHLRFTTTMALALAACLVVAVLAPSLPLSIAAFTLAGVASGPIFPMIVALGGERYPERSAAVGGLLTGLAVVGATLYPPAMGVISVAIDLQMAMLGTAVLALVAAVALVAFGRVAGRRA